MDRLSELLRHHVQFRYTAWDRIVLNGYLDRLQRPENIVYFFREVVGAPCVTPEVLMSRTAPYRAWVTRFAQDRGIPLLAAPQWERKEDVVAPYYHRFQAAEGVVCILTSTEQHGAARSRGGPSSRTRRATRPAAATPAIARFAPAGSGSCTTPSTPSTCWIRSSGR